MYTSTIASAAVLGLATISIALPTQKTTNSSLIATTKSSSSASAFKFPLANGFPDIKNPSDHLTQIQQDALGTLPKAAANAPKGAKPQPDSITSLGFIAFNELFEVAFFTDLITNITTSAPGFGDGDLEILGQKKDDILKILTTVLAQEELHELNANGAFETLTGHEIEPCQYIFPASNFRDAIRLAATFTDVVLGTLPDIQTIFANDNDNGLIRGVGSVIGQEGEQNGFYRQILGKNPSALPFLTASARDFAFSAINQNFVVPSSCPSLDILKQGGLKIFDVLTVVEAPAEFEPKNQDLKFSFKTSQTNVAAPKTNSLVAQQNFLTYVNQQNAPVSVAIEDQSIGDDGAIHFTAHFPGADNEMNGLTIAAITTGKDFVDVDTVAKATLFGPALIEID
ncbi:hypothetical protein CLAFUW4_13721 [Fulvia fulva]|uniref:Sexual development protein n=1 Tax=Passalora fulva TaxID=5499 RepID=A0A9Q8PLM0_PASFU|nr:uncharacterized protein CLAFUR5_13569 [Fulvia fulva]KAK4610079.1 hypothetical protein CLAFUR4_13724 [Fulvia fulva]KAK4611420.1 hypothetical protein CLAFUR0_13728 [Fulvia fulva]UJO24801.1 hypothetical protein CLAFUR5_13569 [Fulvia fulva]WPV21786.1 hypothetical protein CLAFUW4_13721 [Fulvia fulva]WPV37195.1 hypothetical protein CLAFUW7_13729 [Fulvia fulva]